MDGPLNDGPNMTDARPATSDAVDPGHARRSDAPGPSAGGPLLRGSGILLAFVVLIALGALQSEHFLTFDNFSNVARQASITGILGIGMTFVILTAGIDLSVGSILGIVAIGYASILAGGVPWPLAIVIALGFGAFVGSINGLGITRGGIQPFIMTLGMLVIARGVTLTYSDAKPIRVGEAAADIAWIGTGTMLGLPVPFMLFMGIAGLAWFSLNTRPSGARSTPSATTSRRPACRASRRGRVIFSVYVISGLCAAVSALIVVARLAAAEPTQGEGFELDAIAIVVIGGTSLFGGSGGIPGTLVGAGSSPRQQPAQPAWRPPFSQRIAKGLIILGAVLLERRTRARRKAGEPLIEGGDRGRRRRQGGRTHRGVQAGRDGSPEWNEAGGTNGWHGSDLSGQSPSSRSSRCSAPARQPRRVAGHRSRYRLLAGEWQRRVADQPEQEGRRELQPASRRRSSRTRSVTTQSSRATSTSSSVGPVSVLLLTPNTAAGLTEAAKRALERRCRSSRSTAASMSRSPSTSAPTTSSSARPPRSTSARRSSAARVARSSRSRARPAPRRRPTATTSS